MTGIGNWGPTIRSRWTISCIAEEMWEYKWKMLMSFVPNFWISNWDGNKTAEVQFSIFFFFYYTAKCSCFQKRELWTGWQHRHDCGDGLFWIICLFPAKMSPEFDCTVCEILKWFKLCRMRLYLSAVGGWTVKSHLGTTERKSNIAWSIKSLKWWWHFVDALREMRLLQKTWQIRNTNTTIIEKDAGAPGVW